MDGGLIDEQRPGLKKMIINKMISSALVHYYARKRFGNKARLVSVKTNQ